MASSITMKDRLGAVFVLITVMTIALFSASAKADTDFSLIDQNGVQHQMSWYDNNEYVVIFSPNEDTVVKDVAYVQSLHEGKEVEYFLISQSDTNDFGTGLPVLLDEALLVSEMLEIKQKGDVVVVDPKSFKVVSNIFGKGEEISFPEYSIASYPDDIVPFIAENCASCHRDGGIAPFAMDNYLTLSGWSPLIREAILTKQMPPGQLDPNVGNFTNHRTLSPEDQRMIIGWIDRGRYAKWDTKDDPLSQLSWPESEWANGEPDLIIEVPPQEIPATGVLDYRYLSVDIPIEEDKWVRGSQWLPSDPTVMHHSLNQIVPPDGTQGGNLLGVVGGSAASDAATIAAYVPGGTPEFYDENTGGLLKAGSKLMLQLHYTTNGRASIDKSRIGVYFHDEGVVPEERMSGDCACIFTPTWTNIPPYDPNFVQTSTVNIQKDVMLHTFLPHMHFRGKSMRATANYPDGTSEELINVANYNYDWQLSYEFAEPKLIPAGSTIVVKGVFDNSEQNRMNPDPSRSVPWGQMSWDEMFFGAMTWKNID
jgi:hypothetical protein